MAALFGRIAPRRAGVRRFISCRAGVAAVEFAVIAPVVLLMLAGLIEFGLATNTRMSLESGARAGAQFALEQGFDLAAIRATVTDASDLTLTPADVAAEEFYECSDNWGTTVPAGTECADDDDDEAALAKFIRVTATQAYNPFLSIFAAIMPSELQGSAVVRVP